MQRRFRHWRNLGIALLASLLALQILAPAQATNTSPCASGTGNLYAYKNTTVNLTDFLNCADNSLLSTATTLYYRTYVSSASASTSAVKIGTSRSGLALPVAADATAVSNLTPVASPNAVTVFPTAVTAANTPTTFFVYVTDGGPNSTTITINLSVADAPCTASTVATHTLKGLKATARTFDLKTQLGCKTSSTITYAVQLEPNSPTALRIFTSSTANQLIPDALSTPVTLPSISAFKIIADEYTLASPYSFTITASDSALPQHSTKIYHFQYLAPSSVPAAPTCVPLVGFATAGTASRINLAYDSTTGFGCNASANNGPLTYTFSKANHGTLSSPNKTTGAVTFTPTRGYLTPQDYSTLPGDEGQRAFFFVQVTDEYGQQSSSTRIYVQVVKAIPSKCGITRPKSEVLFNDPSGAKSAKYPSGGKAAQFAITNRMLGYIDCAEHGAVITMSWFSLTDMDFVYHLNAAVNRGANVRFLINSHATKPSSTSYFAWNNLKKILGTNAPKNVRNSTTYIENSVNKKAGSWALFCDHGCLTPTSAIKTGKLWKSEESEYPALHAKFFLITNITPKSSKVTSVSGVASSNPTRAQAVQGFNNAQIFVEKGKSLSKNPLFTAFDSYFRKLSAQGKVAFTDKTPSKAASYTQLATKGNTQFVTFPRVGGNSSTDDMTELFKNIQCRYTDANGKWQRTKIYMNMFVFTRNSPAIALWHLANNRPIANGGCEIHIIYTDMDQAIFANGSYIKGPGGYVSWGVADCLSTSPTLNGKYSGVTVPERRKMLDSTGKVVRTAKGKIRYQTISVCKRGALMGTMPTINQGGGYCWINTHSSLSGGSIRACVSTPLKLTKQDPADGRAKLEAWPDANNHVRFSHQKYVLVDGKIGNEIQHVVYSGTPNLTSPGLRYNDEVMTITSGDSFFKAYKANFDSMLKFIHNRPGPLPDVCRIDGSC